jgi:hypothetical protein
MSLANNNMEVFMDNNKVWEDLVLNSACACLLC